MKILWLTWKDRENPLAGGAEIVNEELAKRLAKEGHEVLFLVAGFSGAKKEERREGFEIIRLGGRWSVYWQVFKYYKNNLKGWADLVIDEINTVPFFAKFYVKEKNILFVHQLCREIWFYEIFFPLNLLGYLVEPIYLWLLRDRRVITVSESSKKDLLRFGFKEKNIKIISEGIEIEPVGDPMSIEKYNEPTILSLGTIRTMKRIGHVIKAFENAKGQIKNLRLIVAGAAEARYEKKVLKMIKKSGYSDSIEYLGKISVEKKIELMRKAHLLVATSVKEGWGLIVTEANSQGTPAVVYNTAGLRDSVKNNETGLVCDINTPQNLAEKMIQILQNKDFYRTLRENGWRWSREINFEKSCVDFLKCIT
jgi:glycosyltransferase involved in cell wall biosynthesis